MSTAIQARPYATAEQMAMVSERALMARINRHLAQYEGRLHKSRENSRWLNQCGYYYIHWFERHSMDPWINLSELGREFGVLKNNEKLQDYEWH